MFFLKLLLLDELSGDNFWETSFGKPVFFGEWDEGAIDGGRISCGGEFLCIVEELFEVLYYRKDSNN